jgi:hypothetical protein
MKKEKGFDCPACKRRCYVHTERGKTKLKHPLPVCEKYEPKLLLQAYVLACNPRTKFPPIDEIAKETWEKGIE